MFRIAYSLMAEKMAEKSHRRMLEVAVIALKPTLGE